MKATSGIRKTTSEKFVFHKPLVNLCSSIGCRYRLSNGSASIRLIFLFLFRFFFFFFYKKTIQVKYGFKKIIAWILFFAVFFIDLFIYLILTILRQKVQPLHRYPYYKRYPCHGLKLKIIIIP